MPTYGALEPFHGEGGAWTEYLERVKLFFNAKSLPEENKKSVFLTCCGSGAYSLLRSLLTPKTPDQVSIDEIFSVLSGHYIPKPSVVVCHFRFNCRSHQTEESVSDYTASLKKLSANCEYGTFLPDMLRDRLVCGINDASMQRRLLEEPNLTLESAVKLLIAMETAKRDSSMLMQSQGMIEAQTVHSAMSYVIAVESRTTQQYASTPNPGATHAARLGIWPEYAAQRLPTRRKRKCQGSTVRKGKQSSQFTALRTVEIFLKSSHRSTRRGR
ncbi:hypothetical protein V5799_014944 [Amblyomma americanum]|uniref:Tick transposon n=1 Tax=Amblyomma americanum TaxID=6943 RepID=A0AAQ4E1K0_AMBAM